jgi:hypothetical protein
LRVFVAVPELGLPLPFALRMWCGAPKRELDIMRSEILELVLDSGRRFNCLMSQQDDDCAVLHPHA